jgi:hypothetical protein
MHRIQSTRPLRAANTPHIRCLSPPTTSPLQ